MAILKEIGDFKGKIGDICQLLIFIVDICVEDGELHRLSTYMTWVARDPFPSILGENLGYLTVILDFTTTESGDD